MLILNDPFDQLSGSNISGGGDSGSCSYMIVVVVAVGGSDSGSGGSSSRTTTIYVQVFNLTYPMARQTKYGTIYKDRLTGVVVIPNEITFK